MATSGDDADLEALSRRIGRTLHRHRVAQERSVSELARAAGLSKTIVARLEAGAGNPSVETLWRLATALGLPLSEFLEPGGEPTVEVFRARSGKPLRGESGMAGWLLHAEGRPHRFEVFEIELPGIEHAGTPHLPGTRELVVCLAGRLEVGPVDGVVALEPGDAALFAADVAHVYRGDREARGLDFVLYPGGAAAG